MQGGSVFNPNSSLAHPIWHLFWIVGIVMAVILLLVTTLVLYVCIRYRDKKNHVIPEQKYGHSALEIAWTIAPFLVLIFIFVATIHAMQAPILRRHLTSSRIWSSSPISGGGKRIIPARTSPRRTKFIYLSASACLSASNRLM